MTDFYARLAKIRGDDTDLSQCVERVVNQLNDTVTSSDAPGMLLGKIQSGKTRGFLGVIARAFDRGFDIAIVLTKGTKTLASQTVKRIGSDFKEFIDDEEILLFDIMETPERLTRSERRRKMVIVAKKQNKNLERVLELLGNTFPELKDRRLLLVDDEADMASVRFVKNQKRNGQKVNDRSGEFAQGTIAQQMDDLRELVKGTAYLQVTATPYALYLQPEEYTPGKDGFIFYPKKPAFTELLPIHGGYVGGDDYFGDFDEGDPRRYLFVDVPEEEQNALRSNDERTIRGDRLWSSKNIVVLRRALMTFILAVYVRRWQQADQGLTRLGKYAMIMHNDTQRQAHEWQWKTVEGLCAAFDDAAEKNDPQLRTLFNPAYEDIAKSVRANKGRMPTADEAFAGVVELIRDGEINVQRVNSDVQLAPLLDPNTAELRLRAQANIFIGGSILDRGITVPALISFYYGRNPKRMQADTVLQHSRMYGNRDRQDLAVTRFYTSQIVRDRLEKIHKLESTLRDAFENGLNDGGVVFIQKDGEGGIVPCSPSKILVSEIVSVKANDLYLPTGFDTVRGKTTQEAMQEITRIAQSNGKLDSQELTAIGVTDALEIIRLIQPTMKLDSTSDFEWEAMEGLLKYYARDLHQIDFLAETGRKLDRLKSGDKSGLSILGGGQIRNVVRGTSRSRPALILLEQEGSRELNWSGNAKFWWPILAIPTDAEPCVFSNALAL